MTGTVLISGATGFIGRPLAAMLQARGYVVRGLSRDPGAAAERVPGLKAFAWPSTEEPVPDAAVDGADAILNLHGETASGRWSAKKKQAFLATREIGTRRIVEAMSRVSRRPTTFVSASAIGYYGDRNDEIMREDSGPGDGFIAEVASTWEREAMAAAELGARVVRLRTGLVLGPGGGALEAMRPLFLAGLGGPLGSGRQYWSWIHRSDVIGLFVRALEDASWQGAYNAVAPEPVRQREFARALAKVLHRPGVLPAPAFAIRTILGEFAGELLSSRRVVPARALEAGFSFLYPELEAALADALDTR